jgi:hypothetical protein
MQAQQAKINFIISDGLSVLFHTYPQSTYIYICTYFVHLSLPPLVSVPALPQLSISYILQYSFQRFCFVQPFFTSPFINSIYVPRRIMLLHCRFIKNISVQHNLTKEIPNKSVLNTEVNKNQLVQRFQRSAGSCAVLYSTWGVPTQLNLD